MIDKRETLKHLDELIVEHRLYRELKDHLLTVIQEGARGRIIMVVGSTGVGKTWLSLDLESALSAFVEKHFELGFAPPLLLEAESPEFGEFSWRAFYTEGLRKLGEPALSSKLNIDSSIEDLKLGRQMSTYQHLKVHELRTLYLQALDEIRPIAVVIDEIASIGKSRSHDNRGGNLNVLKSFSNRRATIQILLGTVEAKKMLYHEAQTARRVEPLPFWHYSSAPSDLAYFTGVIVAVLKEIGVTAESALFEDKQYLYAHTLGLVGVGVEWIRRGLERMFQVNDTTLKKQHLNATRLSNIQLSTMARDMAAFEVEFSDVGDFDPAKYAVSPRQDIQACLSTHRKTKHVPGRRNPVRDPVGPSGTDNNG